MSSHTTSTSSTPGDQPRRGAQRRDLAGALGRAQRALLAGSVVAFDGPPPEVQRELAQAARAWRRLAAQGREVRFDTGADGRVLVQLTDRSGHALSVIGPAGLFRLLSLAS